MPGRLAIDFGTSNTVLAVWDEKTRQGVPLDVPTYGQPLSYRHGNIEHTISVVPSVIHYTDDDRRWLGRQVHEHGVYDSPHTFRWMKRYIARRSPWQIRVGERPISHAEAGRDFLAGVLGAVTTSRAFPTEEVAFTVPVEAFEDYANWLTEAGSTAGFPRFRLIDEPSAAALGYGVGIRPNDVYLIFDFGGGTLDVSVVLIEEGAAVADHRRCRVLGKAGADLGGATMDGILFQEVLAQAGRQDSETAIRRVSRSLLVACESAKERLSSELHTTIQVPLQGDPPVQAQLSRQRFEDLLDVHGVFTTIDRTLRRALAGAEERGYREAAIKAVLLAGGSSLVPSVQRLVARIFGRERVRLDRPVDAIARGAAAFVAGVDFFDHIQHDYAIRHVDAKTGEVQYRLLVQRGTAYPTTGAVARLTVKASYEGQGELGLAIFEMGESPRRDAPAVELIFDPSGAARIGQVTAGDREDRARCWVNEHSPTFLQADPPAERGAARFEVTFGIDANKRLLVTARDLQTGRLLYREHPVVKLT